MSMYNGNQAYNIVTETELATILSHFSTPFVMSVLEEAMRKRNTEYSIISIPNVVHGWESYFKVIMEQYKDLPNTRDEVMRVRALTYIEIINAICREFGLSFTTDDTVDLYTAASNMYEFFVCNFAENMVNVLSHYIYKERNAIYDYMNFTELKKKKDSSTIYGKKVFKDIKLAVINANIDSVISAMGAFDISLNDIFGLINNTHTAYYMSSIVFTDRDFYKEFYMSIFNTHLRADYLTAIRLKLQAIATATLV